MRKRNRLAMMAALAAGSLGLALAQSASAGVIAQWTFETSAPTTAGPISPEVGSGAASGSHAGATVYSSPSGNGSTHSYSSSLWAIGDYYQFTTSTTGSSGIQIVFDQGSSNTGPRDFILDYSTDGTNFTQFGSQYSVVANAAPNPTWNPSTYNSIYNVSFDLSSVTALDNQAAIYFRLVDNSTFSANGGTVGTGGTDRVDNVTIGTGIVPEPASLALLGVGGLLIVARRRRA
jgi:hypothetical protein